jgi:two-component system sensor histidine kinase UhpB
MSLPPLGPSRGARLPWRTLTFQLFAIIILPLTALLLTVTFGSIKLHQNAMRALVGERDQRAVLASANALGDQIEGRLDAIRSLSLRAEAASTGGFNEILTTSDYLSSDFDFGLAFFSNDGALLASTGDQAIWKQLSSSSSSDLKSLLSQGSSGIDPQTFPHPLTAERVALVFAEVPGRDWVAVGAYSTQTLIHHTLASAFPADQQASVIVVDANDQLLYRSGPYSFGSDGVTHPGVAEALRGESGTTYQQVDGSEHVVAYSPVGPVDWGLVIEEPWETVVTPTLLTTQVAPLVLVPVLLLALLALWFGVRQVVQPLQALEAQAADLAWGNYQAIEKPVGGIGEIRNLQAGLIHMARKVQAAQQSLHGYIGAITAGQEEERRRLARELHDDTIQSLIALKQRVQLAHLASGNGSTERSLEELETLAENTIENLRRMTRALRPIYLEDLGLVAALEMLAGEIGKITGFPIAFQRLGAEKRLAPLVELALYRMVQEALSNVARHAVATQSSVNITFTDREIRLEVCDNGKGFTVPKSPAEFAPGSHFGLLGLYERAELIGASLKIQSSPGQGTCLLICLPA